jgi:hypothetical protein
MSGNEPLTNLFRVVAGANAAIPLKVEALTRAHTFMIGMRMAELLGATGEARYQLAKNFTWRTMYGGAQMDRPRVFTGPMGMIGGLFKNFMFHYIADWGLYGREALKGNYQGLLWATAGTASIGGLGALPLYAVADGFQRAFSNKPAMEILYDSMGPTAGDAIFYGMPGLFGTSIQGSASAPFNDPVRDMGFMFNVALLDRASKVGKLGGEMWNQWTSGGLNPLETSRTWEMASYALGPRTLYKAIGQVQNGALRSVQNGRPIMEGVTPTDWALNTIGLTPTRIARAWEAGESLYADQAARQAQTSAFGLAFSEAWARNDSGGMGEVLARAVETDVDISAVMASAMTRMRNNERPQLPFDYLKVPGAIERMRALGVWQ